MLHYPITTVSAESVSSRQPCLSVYPFDNDNALFPTTLSVHPHPAPRLNTYFSCCQAHSLHMMICLWPHIQTADAYTTFTCTCTSRCLQIVVCIQAHTPLLNTITHLKNLGFNLYPNTCFRHEEISLNHVHHILFIIHLTFKESKNFIKYYQGITSEPWILWRVLR